VNAFTIFGRMTLDDGEYQRGLKSAEGETKKAAGRMAQDWKKVGEAAQTVGKTLSVALTAPIVAFGALAVRTAGDFEAAMNKVRGITQATGADFQRLEQLAKDLGATTQFSASQAADAMGFLAMAGFSVDDIMSALPGTLELAAAGNLDLARAADIASNVLSGFGLEAAEIARVNDVLALASISANTNVEQLGNAFKFVAPVAAALGVSVEEAAAAIGIMSDAGIQGEMAGTALRNILGELAKESDELGINVYDLNGQMLPLADIIQQLEVRGLNTAEAMGEFGQRAGPALQALLSRGSGALRDLTANLEDAGGTASRLATTNMEGFNGAVLNLRSAIEGLQIAIAQSGLLAFFQGLVERFTAGIRFLTTLNPQLLQLITIFAGIAAAIGPVLFTIGTLILQVPKLTAAIAVLRGALAALFVGPQAVIVLAVLAVVALAEAYRRNFGGIQDKTEEVLTRVREAFANLATSVGEVVTRIVAAWARLTNTLGDRWGRVSDYLGTAFATAVNGILRGVELLVTGIDAIIRAGITVVERWEDIQEIFRVILDGMRRVAYLTGQLILRGFDVAVEGIKAVFVGLALAVEKIFIGITNFAIKELNALIGRVSGFASRFGIELKQIETVNSRTWQQVVDDSTEGLRIAQTRFEITQADMAATVRNTQIIVSEFLGNLRQHMIELGASSEEADAIVGALGETISESAGAFEALNTALVGPDGTSGTTGAANDAADALGNLVNVANPNIQVLINNALYLRDLARAHLEAAAAASQASVDFQKMTDVSTSSADTVRDFVSVVPQVSVVLNDNATALGFVVDAHWRLAEAERLAAENARAFADAGLGASTVAQDFAARQVELADAANAAAVGLGASNTELALTPQQAADAATQLVAFMQVQRDLGRATDDDVNRALVAQAQALVALRGELTPLSAEWMTASNQLAGLYNGLRDNESALLEQMARVHENTSEWTALEGQLERVRAVMALLGLDTGGPPAPLAAVDNAVQQGVQALRTYLDEAGGAVGRFGNLALDVASKFPLVGAALDGFQIEIDSVTGAITRSFDPMTALTSMFMELLGKSESFRNLLEMVNERLAPLAERIIKPLVEVLTVLIDALWPLIEIVINVIEMALQPMVWIWKNVLGPLLTGIANAIRTVWNALAKVFKGMRPIPEPGRADTGGGTPGKPDYATSGAYVQVDESGRARISEGSLAVVGAAGAPGSIANLRSQIQALQALYQNTVDPTERRLAAMWIEKFEQQIRDREVLGPGAEAEQRRRAEEERARQEERRRADEERQRGGVTQPLEPPARPPFDDAPTRVVAPPPPAGSIAALEEERRALQAQLRVAGESEIPELNKRIAVLGEEISRLQRLGLGGPDLAKDIGKELQEVTFGGTPQSIQLAVATPLVEASERMLDAANVMNSVFGSMMPGAETGFGALPPFTSAIERMTPVLERLLSEGVSVMMGQQSNAGPLASPTAFLRGV
jgi:TP901 family phage tail tape measure protein